MTTTAAAGTQTGAETATAEVLDGTAAAGRAIRGAALQTAGYVVGMAASLASVPFMIRHVGVAEYGYYVTVASVMVMIGGVTEAGLNNLGIREFALREGAARDDLLRNLLGLRMMLTLAGVAACTVILALTGARSVVVTGVVVSGAGLLLTVAHSTYAVALTGTLRLGWVTAIELVRQVSLSATILALVVSGARLPLFFWTAAASSALALAVAVFAVRADRPILPRCDVAEWTALLRETLPFASAVAAALIYTRIAVILMSYVASEVETGLYSAALRIVDVVDMVPLLLLASTYPILARAARTDPERFANAVRRQFDVAIVLGTGMALALIVVAPFAIDVVAGPGFGGADTVLQILAACLLTGFVAETSMLVLLSQRRYREVVIVNLVAVIIAAAATLTLTGRHGAIGGAIATLGAEGFIAVTTMIAVASNPATRLDLAILPKTALAVGAGLVPVLTVDAHPVVLCSLSATAFGAVALGTRAMPEHALRALRSRV